MKIADADILRCKCSFPDTNCYFGIVFTNYIKKTRAAFIFSNLLSGEAK